MDFTRLPKVPDSLENVVDHFKANFRVIYKADWEYNISGILYVAKLAVVPAHEERTWNPSWENPFHLESRLVPKKVGRKELEKYQSTLLNITQSPAVIVDEVNFYFAQQYDLKLPRTAFISLIEPIVKEYTKIKAQRRKGESSKLKAVE